MKKFTYILFIILINLSCQPKSFYKLDSFSIFPINENQISDSVITWNSSYDFMDYKDGDTLFIFRLEISSLTNMYKPPSRDFIVSITFKDSEGQQLNNNIYVCKDYKAIRTRRTIEDEFLNISEFNQGKGYVVYPIIQPTTTQELINSYNSSIMFNDRLLISNFLVLKPDSAIFAKDFASVSVELYSKKDKKNYKIEKKVWNFLE